MFSDESATADEQPGSVPVDQLLSTTALVDPHWTQIDQVKAVWDQPLTGADSIYWTSDESTGIPIPANVVGSTRPMLGESYDFSADGSSYKTRMAMHFEQVTTTPPPYTYLLFSTVAMAPMGGRAAGQPQSVYFWPHDGTDVVSTINCGVLTGLDDLQTIEVLRVTDGSPDVYVGCMPAPGDGASFPPSVPSGYATGGEGHQGNGLIYLQADYGFLDSVAPTIAGANTNWVQFGIWDPVGGSFVRSGPPQPADTLGSTSLVSKERQRLAAYLTSSCPTGVEGDAACDYGPMGTGASGGGVEAAADFGLDAQGDLYIFVSTPIPAVGQYAASLVRISPARDGQSRMVDGSSAQPWTYSVVKRLTKSDPGMVMAESPIWATGTGITGGKLFATGNINVYSTTGTTAPNNMGFSGADQHGTSFASTASRMLGINPLSGSMAISSSTQNDGPDIGTIANMATMPGRIYRDSASTQMLAVVKGRVLNDINSDGVFNDGEPGLAGVEVAIYNADNALIGLQHTDSSGEYSAIVPSSGTFQVRVLTPIINGEAATQTFGDIQAGQNQVTMHCTNGNIVAGNRFCPGALPVPFTDPPVGDIGQISDPTTWPFYATANLTSDSDVAQIDFGFTAVSDYIAPSSIDTVVSGQGSVAGGETMTLTGNGLTKLDLVTVTVTVNGDAACGTVKIVDDKTMTCLVPPSTRLPSRSGAVDVDISDGTSTIASLTDAYVYTFDSTLTVDKRAWTNAPAGLSSGDLYQAIMSGSSGAIELPIGATITPGTTVTWTYTVEDSYVYPDSLAPGTADIGLTDAVVTDDQISGAICTIDTLMINQSTGCAASGVVS
ncbi:MAG: IPT/TIG domain-containing protein [Propionibacteriaceae bacterium]|nr:IPT/TIG domain-containing protein [Propionibacteriaceae bacterium]